MAIQIVNEGDTLVATITYKDSTGAVMSPETSAWQLQKKDGTIVNSRSFANGSFTGTYVVMSGDDLELDSTADTTRIFAIEGTYDSSYGSGLTFTQEVEFEIRNLYSQT